MQSEIYIAEFEQILAPIDFDNLYLMQLFDIYHQRLLANTDAMLKLVRRGINERVIQERKIGICDHKLNRYVKPIEHAEGAEFRGALRKLGLTNINGHELFRGCIVEAVHHNDSIVAACGVKLICPSRPAPRIIQWYRHSVYHAPVTFELMAWGKRYVTH
ncbi:hypothetical protein MN202_20135 [Rheinheimera muenzenbergensis]|uniref:Uncharacterized protein n=1 Tax=Rheinheimera muenzenbergensis TaxID=1193628 RepID=A0ABU8CDM7_9GAMM